jgi:hypothetical protein
MLQTDTEIMEHINEEGNIILTNSQVTKLECSSIEFLSDLMGRYRQSYVINVPQLGNIIRIPTSFGEQYLPLNQLVNAISHQQTWKFMTFDTTPQTFRIGRDTKHISHIITYQIDGQEHQEPQVIQARQGRQGRQPIQQGDGQLMVILRFDDDFDPSFDWRDHIQEIETTVNDYFHEIYDEYVTVTADAEELLFFTIDHDDERVLADIYLALSGMPDVQIDGYHFILD